MWWVRPGWAKYSSGRVGDQIPLARNRREIPFTDQIETLLSTVPEDGGPCLIAGDFNTMGKRSLQSFESSFLSRGFQRATSGLGSTFDLGPLGFAMDHVFVRGMEVVDAGVVEGAEASDHAPVWVLLVWDVGT